MFLRKRKNISWWQQASRTKEKEEKKRKQTNKEKEEKTKTKEKEEKKEEEASPGNKEHSSGETRHGNTWFQFVSEDEEYYWQKKW